MCNAGDIVNAHCRALRRYSDILELEQLAGEPKSRALYCALSAAELAFITELEQLLGVDECDS
jgi:hypothetical protein